MKITYAEEKDIAAIRRGRSRLLSAGRSGNRAGIYRSCISLPLRYSTSISKICTAFPAWAISSIN